MSDIDYDGCALDVVASLKEQGFKPADIGVVLCKALAVMWRIQGKVDREEYVNGVATFVRKFIGYGN